MVCSAPDHKPIVYGNLATTVGLMETRQRSGAGTSPEHAVPRGIYLVANVVKLFHASRPNSPVLSLLLLFISLSCSKSNNQLSGIDAHLSASSSMVLVLLPLSSPLSSPMSSPTAKIRNTPHSIRLSTCSPVSFRPFRVPSETTAPPKDGFCSSTLASKLRAAVPQTLPMRTKTACSSTDEHDATSSHGVWLSVASRQPRCDTRDRLADDVLVDRR